MISSFRPPHAFLSSFYPSGLIYHEHSWPTAEHAFQASKATSLIDYQHVKASATPAEAKRRGRKISCRADWDAVKRQIMLEIVLAKFTQDGELRDWLAQTSPAVLVEGNTWGDTYWGAVLLAKYNPPADMPVWRPDGYAASWLAGENWLGRILMMAREVLT